MASKRTRRTQKQSSPTMPEFSSGGRLTNMSPSITTTDRHFGGKSGVKSISGPKAGKGK